MTILERQGFLLTTAIYFLNHLSLNYCGSYSAQHNTQQSDPTMATSEPEIILTLTPVPYPDVSPYEPSLELTSPVSVQNNTWVSTFSVPWEKTHESLRRCLAQRKRAEAADRRHMVRVIAEAIRQVCPPFRQCAELAKSIIDKSPDSSEDRTEEGERLGNGYYTLSKQLRTRIEFLNRYNTLTRLQKPKRLILAMDEDLPGDRKSVV